MLNYRFCFIYEPDSPSGTGVSVGAGVSVAVGAGVSVAVGAGVSVAVGAGVYVAVGSGVGVTAGSGVGVCAFGSGPRLYVINKVEEASSMIDPGG